MSNPAPVSVLLPVYNAEPYLGKCIESILGQTFKKFELIAIDDGSTDRSGEILDEFAKKDARVHVIHQKNQGLVPTLNRGLDLARSQYIARCDADDFCDPNRLQIQIDFLEAHPEVGVVSANFTEIDRDSNIINHGYVPETDAEIRMWLLFESPFCHAAAVFRRAIFEQHQLRYDPQAVHIEDYELWTRLLRYTKGHNVQKSLYVYRKHGENVTTVHFDRQQRSVTDAIYRHHQELGFESSQSEIQIYRRLLKSTSTLSTEQLLAIDSEIFPKLDRLIRTAAREFGATKSVYKAYMRRWFDKTLWPRLVWNPIVAIRLWRLGFLRFLFRADPWGFLKVAIRKLWEAVAKRIPGP